MPTYKFNCPDHGEFEDFVLPQFPDGKCPTCSKPCQKEFTTCSNISIPAWMSATGDYASQKQAVYLKSDRHRQRRVKQEKDQEKEIQRADRLKVNQEKLSHTIAARVEDNSKYSDQSPQAVTQRAKQYNATKFAS